VPVGEPVEGVPLIGKGKVVEAGPMAESMPYIAEAEPNAEGKADSSTKLLVG